MKAARQLRSHRLQQRRPHAPKAPRTRSSATYRRAGAGSSALPPGAGNHGARDSLAQSNPLHEEEVFSEGSGEVAALLGRELTPSGKRVTIATLLSSGGFTISFKAPGAGSASIDWYDVPSRAKLSKKVRARAVLVASGRATFRRRGPKGSG